MKGRKNVVQIKRKTFLLFKRKKQIRLFFPRETLESLESFKLPNHLTCRRPKKNVLHSIYLITLRVNLSGLYFILAGKKLSEKGASTMPRSKVTTVRALIRGNKEEKRL